MKERKRLRLPEYDYGENGAYFVTICSYDRLPLFSSVIPGRSGNLPGIMLTETGAVIERNLLRIPELYTEISVENYVIMPNHIHVLISVTGRTTAPVSRDKMLIPKILQSFKASVTRELPKECRPVWQSGYYDHVIRDFSDFQIKWQYIENNPARWIQDRYHVEEKSFV